MKKLILLALVMAIISFAYICIRGDVYECEHLIPQTSAGTGTYHIETEEGGEHISIDNLRVDGNTMKFTVHALSAGKAVISVYNEDGTGTIFTFFVHKPGFITEGSRLGNCTGGNIIIIMTTIYAAVILGVFIKKYKDGIKKNYYSYHNITLLGMIIFVLTLILSNTLFALNRNGLIDFIRGILSSAGLTIFLIPFAMLITVAVFISNIVLIVKEGANKKNVLGTVFSFGYLIFLIFPLFFEGFLQIQELIDVHKETGFGHYLDIIVTNFCYSVTTYMTVILIATIIMGIRSAHRTPAFNKDFILILGCRIRKDGQVTPLLKGRADAAIRFANAQKKATGKDICFVPSGGKGSDEVISEAEAVRNYLLTCGIDEEQIITEDNSANTDENFRFSLEKIREVSENKEPAIAFATSGYHVFRSGYIATQQGIYTEGVGASTKVYFWINAFIRELIATLYYEKKKHLLVIATLLIAVTLMGSLLFLSVVY